MLLQYGAHRWFLTFLTRQWLMSRGFKAECADSKDRWFSLGRPRAQRTTAPGTNLAVPLQSKLWGTLLDLVDLLHVLARPRILFGHIRAGLQALMAARTRPRLCEGKHVPLHVIRKWEPVRKQGRFVRDAGDRWWAFFSLEDWRRWFRGSGWSWLALTGECLLSLSKFIFIQNWRFFLAKALELKIYKEV